MVRNCHYRFIGIFNSDLKELHAILHLYLFDYVLLRTESGILVFKRVTAFTQIIITLARAGF